MRGAASYARLDQKLEEQDLSKVAENITKRYGRTAPTRYTGDMNEIPQRLLMPSVHDANLWQVRVKVGHRPLV
jgi:transcription elongation factor SPT5